MKHEISKDRTQLRLIVTPDEQAELRAMTEIHSDKAMTEFLEPLTSNSELEWLDPCDTGDLTAAPILGIYGEEQRDDATPHGYRGVRCYTSPGMIQPILERWAFMDYQARSVLEDLRDKGECIFISE